MREGRRSLRFAAALVFGVCVAGLAAAGGIDALVGEAGRDAPANGAGLSPAPSRPEQIPAPAWERMLAGIEADNYAFRDGVAGNRAHGLRFSFGGVHPGGGTIAVLEVGAVRRHTSTS